MIRSLALAALVFAPAAAPAAQTACEDAAAALAPYEGRLAEGELTFGAVWLQDTIDLRPDGYDPCALAAGFTAMVDSVLASRETSPAATPTSPRSTAAQPALAVHEVPAGGARHRLALRLPPESEGEEAGYRVRSRSAPRWFLLDTAAPADVPTAGTLAVPFRLGAGAPVGAEETITVDLLAGDAVVGEASFAIRVGTPANLSLGTPFPNPTAGAATLRYDLPAPVEVAIEVVDALGRRVLSLSLGEKEAGAHQVAVAARALAPGAYVVRLSAEGRGGREVHVQRLTVIR